MQRGGPWLFVLALLAALVLGGLASTVAWEYENRATAAAQPPSALPAAPAAQATVAPTPLPPTIRVPVGTSAALPPTVGVPAATSAAGAPAASVTATLTATAPPTRQAIPTAPVATATPAAPPGGNVANGRQLFQQNCNACHPNGDQGVGPALHGAGFRSQFPTDASVTQIIANGRDGMPGFGSRLSAQQIGDIVAYIRSLP